MIKQISRISLITIYIAALLFNLFLAVSLFSTPSFAQEIPNLFIDSSLTIEDGRAMWMEDNYKSALDVFEYLSRSGDEKASWILYSIYSEDSPIGPADAQKVMEVLIRLSEANVADAREVIGDIYYFGRGVPQNYELAAEWYERYIELEQDPDILTRFGILLATGNGVKVNKLRAFKMLYKASRTEHYVPAYLTTRQVFQDMNPVEQFRARSFIQEQLFQDFQQENH